MDEAPRQAVADPPRPSLRETLRRIALDHRRTCTIVGAWESLAQRLFWMVAPNVVALTLYRLSHYLHTHRMKFLAWPVYLLNLYLTGADIPPSSVIGPNCYLGHAQGAVICGVVGSDAMLFGAPGIGGGMGDPAEGRPANGLPVVGDRVVIGMRAMVLGPVFIGDGATIGAGAVVLKDMAPGSTAVTRPSMVVATAERSIDYDAIAGLKKP